MRNTLSKGNSRRLNYTMLRSNWNLYAAIGIAIGIVIGCYLIHRWDGHHYYESAETNEQIEGSGIAIVTALPASDQEQYSYYPGDQKPDYNTRAIWAAEDAAYWAMVASFIGGAGTIIVGFSLILSARATKAALDAARFAQSALEISEKEYIASRRPRIRIKHIFLQSQVLADTPILVDLHYTNVGDGDAVIRGVGIDFNILYLNSPLSGNLQIGPKNVTFDPNCGLGETGIIKNINSGKIDDQQAAGIEKGTRVLCCFGYIEYMDNRPVGMRKLRRTAFVRVLKSLGDPINGIPRFMPLDKPDPDYDFED